MHMACIRDRSVHGFSSCAPRVIGRSPVRSPPFSATCRAVGLDRGRVDRQCHAFLAVVDQRFEDCLPMTASRPAIEAIVDGRVWTIIRRAVAPSRAALKHVDDAADDAPIVIALRTTLVRWQVRRYSRPLLVGKPEESLAHRNRPLAESPNARESQVNNWVQTLRART
jgi:hypothetical protein